MSTTTEKRAAGSKAEPVKTLAERRGELIAEMDAIIAGARTETRALTEEETGRIDAIEAEVKGINATIEAERRALAVRASAQAQPGAENGGAVNAGAGTGGTGAPGSMAEEAEERAFLNYINLAAGNPVEVRAGEQNVTMGSNGAVIPVKIVNRIITTVKEICPILKGATIFSVKGTLKVPVWGNANETHNITVGYQEEFTDITADAGKFISVDLTGYLAGALVLIGSSVINNSEVNVLDFLISEMARQIALYLERELLIGTSGKATGALSTANTLTAAAADRITADELIELQAKIPAVYQKNACWTMNPATFTSIRKLKDASGQYLLLQNTGNLSNGFPYTLLGKPVYVSDNMPVMEAGAKTILYGDYSGLGVNFRQHIEMQVLKELYATKHAVGLVAWLEFDSDVIDHQKLAALIQAAS